MMGLMRRESSTVIVLAGEPDDSLLSALSQSPNVSVARAPAPARPAAGESPAPARPAWEAGALALREAARRRSTYVIVPDDPLADVAAAWRAMWAGLGGPDAVAGFELAAGTALAAWRDKQFELPDYYLVMPEPDASAGADLYLGPLRAARPRRVALATITPTDREGAGLLASLRSLAHGPWWPPLDELLDAARTFYAGGLTEAQSYPT
jgi:hypothetical protein